MIVYLNQKNFDYPEQPENESHWVRNGLLTTGALVGAHFGAKAGLFGRHMQKFAGNNQAWLGNKLKIYDFAKQGEKAAVQAQAKINAGVTGRGMSKEIWQKGLDEAIASGKVSKDTTLGQFMGNHLKGAKASDQITKVDSALQKENMVRNIMGNETQAAKFGIKKDASYDDAVKAFDNSKFGGQYNAKYNPPAQPQTPPPAK